MTGNAPAEITEEVAALLASPGSGPPDHKIDARGLLCPLPIVHLSRCLRLAEPGQRIQVDATDPGFFPDLVRWIRVRNARIECLRHVENEQPQLFQAWVINGAP